MNALVDMLASNIPVLPAAAWATIAAMCPATRTNVPMPNDLMENRP